MRCFFSLLLFFFVSITSLNAQWESLGNNIIEESHRVWSLKLAPDHSIWAISTLDAFPPIGETPKIHRSSDEGLTWAHSEISAAIDSYGWDISPIDSMTAFVALDTAGLYKTVDGGLSWDKIEFPTDPIIVHFFNENDGWVFGGDSTGFLVNSVTSDGGNNWTHIGYGGWGQPEGTSLPPVDSTEYQPAFAYSIKSSYSYSAQSIMYGTSKGNYWLSTDKGYNWVRRSSPLGKLGLLASNVTMKDSTTFMLASDVDAATFGGEDGVSFATTDGGETWIEGTPGMSVAATQYIPGTEDVFIMTNHNDFGFGAEGAAITYDYGVNWERVDFGTRILAMDFIDQQTGIGACCSHDFWNAGQIFKWNLELMTAGNEVIESDKISFFPNPAFDQLMIDIGEKLSGDQIQIDIISSKGQVVKRFKKLNVNRIELKMSDLPSGFYLLRISGDDNVLSGRFIRG